MAIEGALRAYLLDAAANPAGNIATEVGSAVYPLLLPETPTYPAVVLNVVSRVDVDAHSGTRAYTTRRVQADVYGATLAEARVVADKVELSLGARTGFTAGTDPEATLVVHESHVAGERVEWDPDLERARVILDFVVSY